MAGWQEKKNVTKKLMQLMLQTCERFAEKNNLQFSTDPDSAKSKSKSILVTGLRKNLVKPVPLVLNGKYLPWVSAANTLVMTFMRVEQWTAIPE